MTVVLVPQSLGTDPLQEYNPSHEPGGSSKGGQFARKSAPDLVATEGIRQAARADFERAGLVKHDIEYDAHGVVKGKPRGLDARIGRGEYTLADVAQKWAETRALIRASYGDTVRLYRSDAPVAEHHPGTLTLLMGDKAMASNFAHGGRAVMPFDVSVDDIVAVYTTPNLDYVEFIVRKP